VAGRAAAGAEIGRVSVRPTVIPTIVAAGMFLVFAAIFIARGAVRRYRD